MPRVDSTSLRAPEASTGRCVFAGSRALACTRSGWVVSLRQQRPLESKEVLRGQARPWAQLPGLRAPAPKGRGAVLGPHTHAIAPSSGPGTCLPPRGPGGGCPGRMLLGPRLAGARLARRAALWDRASTGPRTAPSSRSCGTRHHSHPTVT